MRPPSLFPFDWADPFALDDQLSDEERLVRNTARGYAHEKLQPRVTKAYLEEDFDRGIMTEMGELGLLGATLPTKYGGAGLNYVGYGLVARAGERVGFGYRSGRWIGREAGRDRAGACGSLSGGAAASKRKRKAQKEEGRWI